MNIKHWPRAHRACFFIILGVFWAQGALFAWRTGNRAYGPTDGTSEGLAAYSARHFVDHGFTRHHLLPTYPPFGENLDGSPRTEPFVYNHYIAGSDLVLGLWMKTFGKDSMAGARLVPHTLSTIGAGVFALGAGALGGSSLLACLTLAFLMLPRAFAVWSTCLYGHSYATAVVLITCGGLLIRLSAKKPGKPSAKAVLPWLLAGFFTPFFALDWLGLHFLLLMAVLLWASSEKQPLGPTLFSVLGAYALGALGAALYQMTLSALELGSYRAAFTDLTDWIAFKRGDSAAAARYVQHSLSGVLREMNRQAYGATGFTAWNLIGIAAGFLVMGVAAKALSLKKALRGGSALLLSFAAMMVWSGTLKSHAMGNLHFILRHSLAVYLMAILVVLPTALSLVERARKGATKA